MTQNEKMQKTQKSAFVQNWPEMVVKWAIVIRFYSDYSISPPGFRFPTGPLQLGYVIWNMAKISYVPWYSSWCLISSIVLGVGEVDGVELLRWLVERPKTIGG